MSEIRDYPLGVHYIELPHSSPCSRPMVTGTSVLGVTFADGVMLAADTLGTFTKHICVNIQPHQLRLVCVFMS